MHRVQDIRVLRLIAWSLAVALVVTTGAFAGEMAMGEMHRTGPFTGPKANTGYATHTKDGMKNVLTLSDDFQVPDTPDPHWRVVDSKGTIYLLQRLDIKGEGQDMKGGMKGVKTNRSIVLPPYIVDVAKVQIWCAWAETLLGEASFEHPVK